VSEVAKPVVPAQRPNSVSDGRMEPAFIRRAKPIGTTTQSANTIRSVGCNISLVISTLIATPMPGRGRGG
jgi:hypothetical protein